MRIKYDEERMAHGHYQRNINYFNKDTLLNAAMSVATFDQILFDNGIILQRADILDFGCGTGETLQYVMSNFNIRSITAIDYSSNRIDFVNELINSMDIDLNKVRVLCQDVNIFLDFAIRYGIKFNVVIAFEIIEHLLHSEIVMNKLKLLLSPNGVIVGTVPIQENANDVHLTAFKSIVDIETKLGVDVHRNYNMRFDNQQVFTYRN